MKECRGCGVNKKNSCFRVNRRKCKECEKAYGRQYSKENRDKRRKWVENNRERMQELQSNWYQKNKEKRNQKEKEKVKENHGFRLYKNNKRNLNRLIHKKNPDKEFLGTKFKIIMEWFEFCFDDEMTWDNYASYWEVDHVIPVTNFDLDDKEQEKLCFDWKNITPLNKKENMKKKGKIDNDQFEDHCLNLKIFIEDNELNEEYKEHIAKIRHLFAKHLDAGIPLEP